MGYDVFSKRCGCGAIHPVRSTCPACIDRKRAEAVAKAGPDQTGSKPGGWITRANTMLDPVKPVAERSGAADALRYAFPDGLRAWLPETEADPSAPPGGFKLRLSSAARNKLLDELWPSKELVASLDWPKVEPTPPPDPRGLVITEPEPEPYTNPQGIGQADHVKRELAVRAQRELGARLPTDLEGKRKEVALWVAAGFLSQEYADKILAEHEPPKPVERDIVEQLRDIMTGMQGWDAREIVDDALARRRQTGGVPCFTMWAEPRRPVTLSPTGDDSRRYLQAEALDAARAFYGMVEDRYGQLRRIGDTSPVVPGPNARFKR